MICVPTINATLMSQVKKPIPGPHNFALGAAASGAAAATDSLATACGCAAQCGQPAPNAGSNACPQVGQYSTIVAISLFPKPCALRSSGACITKRRPLYTRSDKRVKLAL